VLPQSGHAPLKSPAGACPSSTRTGCPLPQSALAPTLTGVLLDTRPAAQGLPPHQRSQDTGSRCRRSRPVVAQQ